jgi:hypothetical protein
MIQRVDAKAVRLSVGRLLAGADLRPPAMPPSAILVVRRMTDPQPGRMAAGLRATTVRREWERRAREQLADLYRRAARPARGLVPDSAEAVCFADESELLACLARDIRSGVVGQRWWWRSILRQRGSLALPVDLLVDRLIARAELVPAVLAQLDRWGEAAGIVDRFTPTQAARILAATLIAHRLPDLIPGHEDAVGIAPRSWTQPPWGRVSASVPLVREQTALLGMALDLHRRPYRVHAPDYGPRLRGWWRAASGPSAQTPPIGDRPAPPEIPLSPPLQTAANREPSTRMESAAATPRAKESSPFWVEDDPPNRTADLRTRPPVQHADPADLSDRHTLPERSAHPPQPTADAVLAEMASEAAPTIAHPPSAASDDPQLSAEDAAVEPSPPGHPPMVETTADAASASIPVERIWPAEGLPTHVGGVLYLINLMLALDLPESGEDGWRLASGVGPWGLLAALGRELLGEGFAAVESDPLWLALGQLDSRPPGEQPGFRLPRSRPRRWPTFQIPSGWRRGSAAPPGDPTAHGRVEGRYRPLLARWLSLALPFIDWRLRAALHLPDDASLAEDLLLLPGQLYLTASQIDLVASLNRISLPVRLAGLDRNPGWLPAWGRAVYFPFE